MWNGIKRILRVKRKMRQDPIDKSHYGALMMIENDKSLEWACDSPVFMHVCQDLIDLKLIQYIDDTIWGLTFHGQIALENYLNRNFSDALKECEKKIPQLVFTKETQKI
jgi:hypothetical protein